MPVFFSFNRYLQIGGKRKRISKSGFKTKAKALKQGMIAYNEYLNNS